MKLFKKLIALTLTGILAVGMTACGNGEATSAETSTQSTAKAGEAVYRSLDEIKESGTINIGVFSDKNPFGYVDENGDYQGYDVYFADRIGKDLGVKVNHNP